MFSSVAGKTVGPVGRVACEPGQSLTAAAISGVIRACVSLAVFPVTGFLRTGDRVSSRKKRPNSESIANPGGAYTVLARRYRSRDFDELIGQEPIARTLQNAIASGRTAHAYLFCGTRGVGKTSMARIFAKALNVDDSLSQKDEIAAAIFRGDDLDVIEIDGASNRGIADAKDLIAGAGLSPARCRYKIYIIDEVHALTKDAFNALLKTMEEPPSHVKFILCTTEAEKVPPTIQSRCQRFNFRPIPVARISEQLRKILKDEGIEASDEVVARVAHLGNGSMRDALSLLDRLLAAGDKTLTVELLEQMVGLPDQGLITDLMSAIIAGEPNLALEKADVLMRQGTTVEQALELLIEHLRSLMVIAACGADSDLVELAGESRATAVEQASHFDTAGLVHLIALCDAVSRNARNSTVARAMFDAAVVRMCMSEHFASVSDLLRNGRLPAGAADDGRKKKLQSQPEQPVRPAPRQVAPAAHQREAPPSVTELKPAPAAPAANAPITGDALWQQVLNFPGNSNMARARLESLAFDSFDGNTLNLRIADEGASAARLIAKTLDELTEIIRKACGRRIDVRIDTGDMSDSSTSLDGDAVREAEQLPLVRQAMDIFDARVVGIEKR